MPEMMLNNRLLRDSTQRAAISVIAAILLLTSFAAAQTLSGTVKNATIGKPSAGDEVIVFSLDPGITETGRTRTDAKGRFSLKLEGGQTRHMIGAIHQGVAYHRIVPAGATSLAIDVYDVAQRVNGIGVVADILRIQAANGQITVTRDFGVRNASKPPRIQMNERNLEFYIPDGAHVVENSGTAIVENGPPMKFAPVAEGEKNRYSFIFPLRPGLTRFEVSYQLPYSGSAKLDPKSIYPLENFMVMLPASMQFNAENRATGFKAIHFPNTPDATVQVASNTSNKQDLAFSVSGEGTLPTGGDHAQSSMLPKENSSVVAPAAAPNGRRDGGSVSRLTAPDLLQKYLWWILSGLAAILIMAGVGIAWRQQAAARAFMRQQNGSSLPSAMRDEANYFLLEKRVGDAASEPVAALTGSDPMRQIKDQLFNIEVERKEGRISQAEFEKAWAALDRMLDSALKREAQNA